MKISVNRMVSGEFEISIGSPDKEGFYTFATLNDIAHSNITSEAEALSRAQGFHVLTGWPIVREYES